MLCCMFAVSYTHLDVYKRQMRVRSFVQKTIKLQIGSWAHQTLLMGALVLGGAGLPTIGLDYKNTSYINFWVWFATNIHINFAFLQSLHKSKACHSTLSTPWITAFYSYVVQFLHTHTNYFCVILHFPWLIFVLCGQIWQSWIFR